MFRALALRRSDNTEDEPTLASVSSFMKFPSILNLALKVKLWVIQNPRV